MALIHVTTGKENNRTSSANIGAYLHVAGKETPLFAAKQKSEYKDIVQQIGSANHYQARRGIVSAVGGNWVSGDYNVLDGHFVKLSISKSQHGQRLHAQVFLYIREDAAFNRLVIPLGLSRHSSVTEGIIEGRFDIITFEEAIDKGAVVPANFERLYSPLMAGRLMQVTEIEPERAPIPVIQMQTVVTDSGDEIRVQSRKRKRSLDT